MYASSFISLSMANTLSKPTVKKETINGLNTAIKHVCSTMQGWRPNNEDAHIHKVGLSEYYKDWSVFAVFDGHAGKHVGQEVSKRFCDVLLSQEYLEQKQFEEMGLGSSTKKEMDYDVEQVQKCLEEAFIQLDETLKGEYEEKQKNGGGHSFDDDDREGDSGCTGTVCLIAPKHIFFANAGDSRNILVRKDKNWDKTRTYAYSREETYAAFIASELEKAGSPPPRPAEQKRKEQIQARKNMPRTDELGFFYDYFSTLDHKPDHQEEKDRIIAAGGSVQFGRVDGNLAVSRAFGDFGLKTGPYNSETKGYDKMDPRKSKVTALPVVSVIERKPEEDAFLIVACDGIFDVIENEHLVQYLTYKMQTGNNLVEIVEGTLDFVLKMGTKDNVSLIIAELDQVPQVVQSVKENEDALNQKLKDFLDDKWTNDKDYQEADKFILPADKMFHDTYTVPNNLHELSEEERKKPRISDMRKLYADKNGDYLFPDPLEQKGPQQQNNNLGNEPLFAGGMDKFRLIYKYMYGKKSLDENNSSIDENDEVISKVFGEMIKKSKEEEEAKNKE